MVFSHFMSLDTFLKADYLYSKEPEGSSWFCLSIGYSIEKGKEKFKYLFFPSYASEPQHYVEASFDYPYFSNSTIAVFLSKNL